jgi:hypothetical protein
MAYHLPFFIMRNRMAAPPINRYEFGIPAMRDDAGTYGVPVWIGAVFPKTYLFNAAVTVAGEVSAEKRLPKIEPLEVGDDDTPGSTHAGSAVYKSSGVCPRDPELPSTNRGIVTTSSIG